jgi:hypothetical protein
MMYQRKRKQSHTIVCLIGDIVRAIFSATSERFKALTI